MKVKLLIVLTIVVVLRIYLYNPGYKNGDLIRISTKVLNEPSQSGEHTRLFIKGVYAYVDKYPEIHYGDNVVVEGKVNGNKLDDAKLIKVSQQKTGLFSIRNSILNFYQSTLPEPHSALVSGIVLGSKKALQDNFWTELKNSGTAHVVVASGMNVTFVATFLIEILLGFMNRRRAILVGLAGVWVYVLLSGLDAPLVRAAIMGSIAFTAQYLGRQSIAVNALFLSAFAMLMVNPLWVQDLGFVLSFVATLSLILFEVKVNRKLHFVPSIIREDLSTSLAAQIGVAPILYLSFGQFNLLSPLINSIILWTVAPVMVIGMVAGIASFIYKPLAVLILYTSYPLTSWFSYVVHLFGQ